VGVRVLDEWEIAKRITLLDRLNTAQKHPKWDAQPGIFESLNTLKKETPKIAENDPKSHSKKDALTHLNRMPQPYQKRLKTRLNHVSVEPRIRTSGDAILSAINGSKIAS
jgi:hypothetical protein